jgi:hypothetical protein
MPTKKPRFNITFNPEEVAILSTLAKQELKSVSCIAKELMWEALERREDMALSRLADARMKVSKKIVSHKDAWK